MDNRIRKVQYFKIKAPNRPGEGARALGPLQAAGVNLLAFSGFPRAGGWQMDFIPEDPAAFLKVVKQAGLKVGKGKTGFLIQGKDRPGAVAEIMRKLAQARINVTAIDAVSAGGGRYGAILWVKPLNVEKAARILGAS